MRSLARGYTDASIQVLGGYLNCEKTEPSIRIVAARELLDRGWGKPNQPAEHKVEGSIDVIIRDLMAEKAKKK